MQPLLLSLRGFAVIVVDGGSDDRSAQIARACGVNLIETRAGRGHQMALGAQKQDEARGQARGKIHSWLLFLHADSRLSEGWEQEVDDFIAAQKQPVAVFRFALDDERWRARIVAFFVWLRCMIFALPYGDQGLLIRRDIYHKIGGFADMRMMEDVALIRHFSRREIHFFKTTLTTSAERYRARGYIRQILRNFRLLLFYYLGGSIAERR